jgi:RNA polymerase sigma factor FliA
MKTAQFDKWRRFRAEKSPELRSELFYSYLKLVKFVAGRYIADARSREGVLQHEDLLQVGMIGLLEAIDRFEPERGFKFETYAASRIQGAIQDELRRIDWLPRSERKRIRDAEEKAGRGEEGKGGYPVGVRRTATDAVLTGEALRYLRDSADERLGEVPGLEIADSTPNVLERMSEAELKNAVIEQIERLPERERLVVTLYYFEELTLKDIGAALGLTESRVSQIHSAVISKMRHTLEQLNMHS